LTETPADTLPRELYSPLKAMRIQKGLSLKTVADAFAVEPTTVMRHERYGNNCSTVTALKYARFYGTSVESLFGYLEPTPPEAP